ncbi:hypothetical protein VHE8714_03401 [Vibrio splendidus]|nr:hypothetical protein VHE8714_03401 [Vibrio splendidus]
MTLNSQLRCEARYHNTQIGRRNTKLDPNQKCHACRITLEQFVSLHIV